MHKLLFRHLLSPPLTEPLEATERADIAALAAQVERRARQRLGRSLALRAVDAGSCNGCER